MIRIKLKGNGEWTGKADSRAGRVTEDGYSRRTKFYEIGKLVKSSLTNEWNTEKNPLDRLRSNGVRFNDTE